MKIKLLKYVWIILLFTLSGCGIGITGLFSNKSAKEHEIEQLQTAHQNELVTKVNEITKEKDNVIAAKDQQINGGTNAMYAADLTFKSIPNPIRTDIVTNNYVTEGWQALGHQMPDAQTIMKINERLKDELDEKKTTLADLQTTHAAELLNNQKLVDHEKELETTVKTLQDNLQKNKDEYQKTLDTKQGELNQINDKLIAKQQGELSSKKEMDAAKMKISIVAGLFALGCIAGAVYSPIWKEKLAICGAVMGIVSIGIWFIQPWMIAVGAAVIVAGVVIFALIEHNKERSAATDVYRAIESIKTKSKDEYEKLIEPELSIWLTKYDKNGNPMPNIDTQNHIDNRLREVGDK